VSRFLSKVQQHAPQEAHIPGRAGVTSLPTSTQEAVFQQTACPRLPAEIQSLTLSAAPSGALCLSAVDSYGSGVVQQLDAEGGCLGQAARLTNDNESV